MSFLKNEYEGVGIGLATVKRIISRHHGKIWGYSDGVGQGAIISFSFPRVKVSGYPIKEFFKMIKNSLVSDEILETINNMGEIYIDKFYLMDEYIKILDRIDEQLLKKMGITTTTYAKWPLEINNVGDALKSINEAYKMNHKSGYTIGKYDFQKIADKKYQIICDTPYPCPYDFGVVIGVAQKFSEHVKIIHTEGLCRKHGDLSCTYEVKILEKPKLTKKELDLKKIF